MAFGWDDAAIVIGSSLFSGIGASGTSPQQKAASKALGKLDANFDWVKESPFSKDEIMNVLLPEAQRIYRMASDVVASKVGASVGESGIAQGQALTEYFATALSPVIARGEEQAAGAISEFGKWFSALDEGAKNRFLQAIQLELQGSSQLPGMDEFQRILSGALQGANLGMTGLGNLKMADAMQTKADTLLDLYKKNGLTSELPDLGDISKLLNPDDFAGTV